MSISLLSIPALSKAFSAVCPMTLTANLYTSLPSICTYVRPFSRASSVGNIAVPLAGMLRYLPPFPSAPISMPRIPYPSGTGPKTAAPAPSPKRTQVLRSLKFNTRLRISAPITRTRLYIPVSIYCVAVITP